VDPVKQLDQHNGLEKGTASKATTEARPWEIRLLVEGFPCRNTGRKLVYNWEHFESTHVVEKAIGATWAKKLKEKSDLEGQMTMLKVLLIACPELHTEKPLKIHFLNAEDMQMFEAIETSDPLPYQSLSDTIECGVLSSLSSLKKAAPDTLLGTQIKSFTS
jgi:hypothetical protein